MGIPFSAQCIQCHLNRNLEIARAHGDEETATAFAKELMKIYLSAPDYASAPFFSPATDRLFQDFYHLEEDRFLEEKRISNEYALAILPEIEQRIRASSDALYTALQFSVLGNYIDYSALHGQVDMNVLSEMLDSAENLALSRENYHALVHDLSQGKNLLILTDNAGEIGFDSLLAKQIHSQFPNLQITFCVRGGPALNDATKQDAEFFQIPFPVIDSGTRISGTVPELLGEEASKHFHEADVILSKGQGNAETLLGCGQNIYYVFLVKCVWFQQLFQKDKFTPMLFRESDWHE